MKIVQETTVWSTPNTPNHVYILDDKKNNMIGYVPAGETKVFRFKAPIPFDRRGRTFVDLKR